MTIDDKVARMPLQTDAITMTAAEFEKASWQLLDLCQEFNIRQICSTSIDLQVFTVKEQPFSTTAKVYLRIGGRVDLVYCPIYQVPVAYMLEATFLPKGQSVVSSASSLTLVKLSYGEHPISGISCLFWHPCQTAKVIKELSQLSSPSSTVRPGVFLVHWLGIYNNHLSLNLPLLFFGFLLDNQQTTIY